MSELKSGIKILGVVIFGYAVLFHVLGDSFYADWGVRLPDPMDWVRGGLARFG